MELWWITNSIMMPGSISFTIKFVYLKLYIKFSAGGVCLDHNRKQNISTWDLYRKLFLPSFSC